MKEQERSRKAEMKDETAKQKQLAKERKKLEKHKFSEKDIVAVIDPKVLSGSVGGPLLTMFSQKDLRSEIFSSPFEKSIILRIETPKDISQLAGMLDCGDIKNSNRSPSQPEHQRHSHRSKQMPSQPEQDRGTAAQQNRNSSTANSRAAGQPEHTTTHQPAEQPPAQDSLNRSKTNHPTSLNRAETQPQKQNSHNHQSRNTATAIRAETQR